MNLYVGLKINEFVTQAVKDQTITRLRNVPTSSLPPLNLLESRLPLFVDHIDNLAQFSSGSCQFPLDTIHQNEPVPQSTATVGQAVLHLHDRVIPVFQGSMGTGCAIWALFGSSICHKRGFQTM